MRNPPSAPTAPAMPMTAEDSLVARAMSASRVSSVVVRSACRCRMSGIIRYVEPLPMPLAAKTNRNAARNHGKSAELASTAARVASE